MFNPDWYGKNRVLGYTTIYTTLELWNHLIIYELYIPNW